MKIVKAAVLAATVLGSSYASLAQQTPATAAPAAQAPAAAGSAAKPSVLTDGIGAKPRRVENMHEVRFIEIFLAVRDPKTGDLVAGCYNTMFTPNGIPASRDTAPQALVEGLDLPGMRTDYGVLGASLNGPKLWLADWSEVDAGVERSFNGIPATWVAQLDMGKNTSIAETVPYAAQTIVRHSGLGWNKGTTVILLDDPKGTTWIMKGFQLGLKPQHTYQQFLADASGQYKKLPKGWKVRVKTLDKDYIEKPKGGKATIMADEFFNVYDKTGPGMGNYKP